MEVSTLYKEETIATHETFTDSQRSKNPLISTQPK